MFFYKFLLGMEKMFCITHHSFTHLLSLNYDNVHYFIILRYHSDDSKIMSASCMYTSAAVYKVDSLCKFG